MSTGALIAATLLTLYLLVVSPLRGRARYLELADPTTPAARRRAINIESLWTKWLATAVALAICWWAPFPIGWWPTPIGIALSVVLVLATGATAVLLVRGLRAPDQREALAGAASKFAAILPRTEAERRLFGLAAVTAGITEEVIFRGFLIAYVAWLLPGGNVYVAALIAGVVFGVLHLYQGWRGVVQTGVVGVAFGLLYPSVGLVVLAVVHSLIDLRLLLLPLDLHDAVPDEPDAGPGDPDPVR